MKEMKMIFENFRKNVKEGWPGAPKPTVPWENKPQKNWNTEIQAKSEAENARKQAMKLAVEDIKRQYNERELHNMIYDELEDLFVNRFSDNLPKKSDLSDEYDLPTEDEVETMMAACKLFKPVEEDDPMASDLEDRVGYMPGDDADWK